MAKKKVLLTGASGSLGKEAFKELLRRKDRYEIVILLRPSRKNQKAFGRYQGWKGLRVVWGDLMNPDDVVEAVNGVNHVLHAAAMIPPRADRNPSMAWKCNYEGTENILNAIKGQADKDDTVRFVYVSTMAAYGDRPEPVHMAQVGDPLNPRVGDPYAVSKIAAERTVIESGLEYWASLRLNFLAIPEAWRLMDPIMFQQPLGAHIELITAEDAGYGLVETLEAPDAFYGRAYNMSGGPSCRVVYEDYMKRSYEIFGIGDYRKTMARNWFPLRNSSCCWYEDSHVLNAYLGHWRQSLEDHHKQMEAAVPWYIKRGVRLVPSFVIKAFLKRMAVPLKWIKNNDQEKIKAFFGSREAWANIPDWDWDDDVVTEKHREASPERVEEAAVTDLRELAGSRGGQCVSTKPGDRNGKLRWRCSCGHEWEATERSVRAGHWCEECTALSGILDDAARADPALARVYPINRG